MATSLHFYWITFKYKNHVKIYFYPGGRFWSTFCLKRLIVDFEHGWKRNVCGFYRRQCWDRTFIAIINKFISRRNKSVQKPKHICQWRKMSYCKKASFLGRAIYTFLFSRSRSRSWRAKVYINSQTAYTHEEIIAHIAPGRFIEN